MGLLVSDPAENVAAWVDVESSGGVNGIIEEVVVLPSPGEDAVYYVVKREINGSTVRYLERWAQEWDARGDGRRASGGFQITGGSSGVANRISSITIDGVEMLDTAVRWAESDENTASLITTAINNSAKFSPVYNGDFLDTSANNIFQQAIFFKPDGTKIYVFGNDAIWQYNLATAWKLTSATFSSKYDTTSLIDAANFGGLVFSPDGLHIVFVTQSGDRELFELDLGTAWEIGSARFGEVRQSLDNAQGGLDITANPSGLAWSGDGFSLFVIDQDNDDIEELTVPIAFRLMNVSYSGNTKSLSGSGSIWGAFFSSDGFILYYTEETRNRLYIYQLETAFDPTTSIGSHFSDMSAWEDSVSTTPTGLSFSSNFTALFVANSDNSIVYRYDFPALQYIATVSGSEVTIRARTNDASFDDQEIVITVGGDVTTSVEAGSETSSGSITTLSGSYRNIGISGRAARNRLADSHITQDTSDPTTSVTGGEHLVGASVVLWGNGKDLGSYTVSSNGTFTASEASTGFVFGLPYSGIYKSAKLAYAAEAGTALTQKKKINHVGLVLADVHPQGLQYGPSIDNLDPMPLVEKGAVISTDDMNQTYDEASIEFKGSWDTDSRIVLKAQAPRPVTVLGAVIQMETKEKI